MHIFPQLRKMEQQYRDVLVVIGVHSAKFTAEKETENIRRAVLRYGIEHPVVNDSDFAVWEQYAVRAWPTLMFIDPEGKVIGKHEGEVPAESLDRLLAEMVMEFDQRNLLDRRPVQFKLEREKEWERPLSFPGKVLADAASGRLFIADSSHNRIVMATLDGQVQEVIGSGQPGLLDGGLDEARFRNPQGMALDGDALYVADTENHAIRAIDLVMKSVKTIAGTGQQAMSYHGGGNGLFAPLNSPWDLAVHDGILYIAMAGFHQLWSLDPDTSEARPYAGNGRERIVDGPLADAELAQPSGIATDGVKLYFTDSESSAIRSADLKRNGRVETIVGLGLFTFGDVDGMGDEVRLQHPLGIDIRQGSLYIADTYNNKVKVIDPATRVCETFMGTGEHGLRDGPGGEARFYEPGGLSIADSRLFIADTNNHAIRIADLHTREVSTLELKWV